MKKTFATMILTLMVSLTVTLELQAQKMSQFTFGPQQKSSFLSVWVNSQALSAFSNILTNATNIKTMEAKYGHHIYAESGEKKIKIVLDKKIRCKYWLAYYNNESLLPADVLKAIKENYYNKSVHSITEVHVEDQTAYCINLEDATTFKSITIQNSEITSGKLIYK